VLLGFGREKWRDVELRNAGRVLSTRSTEVMVVRKVTGRSMRERSWLGSIGGTGEQRITLAWNTNRASP
jgi:hypothetical protein